jgi:thiamine-phosphate pyrophosphorylase
MMGPKLVSGARGNKLDGMRLERAARWLSGGRAAVALIAMTDPLRLPDAEAALNALPRGAALIWRAYGEEMSRARLRRLVTLAHRKHVLLLVAGRPALAARTGMMGIHLPEREVRRGRSGEYVIGRRRRPHGMLLTAACHSEAAIRRAAEAGVGAVLISPVFATKSHQGAKPLGLLRFAQLVRLARRFGVIPYALGGITSERHVRRLKGTGAAGIAGIGFLG